MQVSPEATAVAVKPPGRDRPNRRLTFGESVRWSIAHPLSEAEREAYFDSGQFARDQAEARAAWTEHEREQRLARRPAPVTATGTRRATPRTRERRDRCGRSSARSGDSGDDGAATPRAAAADRWRA